MATPGLIVAAPASGSGKTTITLGVLRALSGSGVSVRPAKVGPDYIDPAFHQAASGQVCHNLDSWAMAPATLAGLLTRLDAGSTFVLCEGVMGLFDGAAVAARPQPGSTAALAALTGWPVLLVVDARGQSESVGALLQGFAAYEADVSLGGVVFNNVGGGRHAVLLRNAAAHAVPHLPVIGCLPHSPNLALPARHLGLVPAEEHPALADFLDKAADLIATHLDLNLLQAIGRPTPAMPAAVARPPLPPLGQRIAVARDQAFAFRYENVLRGWRDAGAEVSFFSPLADAPPDDACDAVYLPGGYPELHAGKLAANLGFRNGLRQAAQRGAAIWGECGGYMVLGEALVDGDGVAHNMVGLLPVRTSFAVPKLHLGYRRVVTAAVSPLGSAGQAFRGHEFHYASLIGAPGGSESLFHVTDAADRDLSAAGHVRGRVAGSFLHLIDREEPDG